MKTNEELKALKAEVDALKDKLAELTNEELAQVSGGIPPIDEFQVDLDPNEREHTCEMETTTGPAAERVFEKNDVITCSPATQIPKLETAISKRRRQRYVSGELPGMEL